MYSYEERIRAIKFYINCGFNSAYTVRKLGYPDKSQIHCIDRGVLCRRSGKINALGIIFVFLELQPIIRRNRLLLICSYKV